MTTFNFTHTLGVGFRQAYRAQMALSQSKALKPCMPAPYNDHDDLVFDVQLKTATFSTKCAHLPARMPAPEAPQGTECRHSAQSGPRHQPPYQPPLPHARHQRPLHVHAPGCNQALMSDLYQQHYVMPRHALFIAMSMRASAAAGTCTCDCLSWPLQT